MNKLFFIIILSSMLLYSQQDSGINTRSVPGTESDRSNLLNFPLTWSRYEIKELSGMADGMFLIHNEAKKEVFKENADKYKVIHIASHTILNDNNPELSRLAFYSEGTSDDGMLNVYEIYNMKLNADMILLSSCNTGFGKMITGEGVMSLARAFMYAGSPSVIMSLWDIDDRSTSEIVVSFYEKMFEGKSKEAALREAKLEYLKDSDQYTANPLLWGGLVSIGDQKSVFVDKAQTGWFWWLLVLLIPPAYIGTRRLKGYYYF
jgi:CHAT domain-containing protein